MFTLNLSVLTLNTQVCTGAAFAFKVLKKKVGEVGGLGLFLYLLLLIFLLLLEGMPPKQDFSTAQADRRGKNEPCLSASTRRSHVNSGVQ